MTSSDGFCSTLTFEAGELGSVYNGPVGPPSSALSLHASAGPFTSTTGLGLGIERPGSSAQPTPVQTPTTAAAGSASPFPSHGHSNSIINWSGLGHQRSGSNASMSSTSLSNVMGLGGFSTPAPTPSAMAANSPTPSQSQTPHIYQPTPIPSSYTNAGFVSTTPGHAHSFSSYGRPSSPTRSNSTSSVATQATGFGIGGSSNNNGIRESNSLSRDRETIISNPTLMGGSVPAVGYGVGATPPQTPRSMASSEVGVKREAGDSTESESDAKQGSVNGPRKKRRIAPTLIGELGGRVTPAPKH